MKIIFISFRKHLRNLQSIFFFSKFQSTTFIHFIRKFSRKMFKKFDDFMQKFQWFVNFNHEFKHENLTFEKYILQFWILFVETFKNWIDNDKKIQTLINKKKMSLKMTKKSSKKLFAINIRSKKSSFLLTTVEKYSFRKKIIKKPVDIIWRKKN